MKIFITLNSINNIGGISTSLLNFLSSMHAYHEIHLCILNNYVTSGTIIPSNVKILSGSEFLKDCFVDRTNLSSQKFCRKLLRSFRRICRRIFGPQRVIDYALKKIEFCEQYDVAIAFENDEFTSSGKLWFGGGFDLVKRNIKSRKKMAWIHNDARKCGYTHNICKTVFEDFNAIIHVSYDNKYIFDSMISEYVHKSYVIYNMYNIEGISIKADDKTPYKDNGKIHLVTVCRLTEGQKKVSRIVETCKRLKCEGYNSFDWTVVGDGTDKATYESKSQANGTTDILHFVGLKTNPYPYMKHADAFILSSLYEGLPMTIREAQITGTPTFSTRFGAAEEAIEVGKQGDICDNSTEGLYSMVKRILDEPSQLSFYRQYIKDHPVTNNIAINQFDEVCKK